MIGSSRHDGLDRRESECREGQEWASGHRHLGAAAIHGRDGVANELKRARRTGKQQRINLAVLDLLGL